MEIKKHMKLLGLKAQDKVTGIKGIITCLSFDLYGCVQCILTPSAKRNEEKKAYWYDISRIKILSKKPVMRVPNFEYGVQARGEQGCSLKSIPGR